MDDTTLLIERSPGETRAALLSGDTVIQVDHYRDHAPPLSGAVFHARVRRIEPGINAAFVDLDGKREGFLRARAVAGRTKGATIANLVQEGVAILVRVLDEAPEEDGKLPRVATLDVDAADELCKACSLPSAPACVDAGPPPVARILAEHGVVADRIVCNDGAVAAAVRQWLETNADGVDVAQESGYLFEAYGVEAAIEAALAPTVALSGGGSLIFEPGNALCAIDVNTGGRIVPTGQAARDANLAAVEEIAHQLRLREIAGAIVIDALDMSHAADRDAVLAALRTSVAADPASVQVFGLTRLGLVELTRRRRRPSLAARLLQPASVPLARPDAVACALLREIAGRARHGAGRFAVRAAPAIVDLLRGPMAEALAESAAWSHAEVVLVADATLPVSDYVIEAFAASAAGAKGRSA